MNGRRPRLAPHLTTEETEAPGQTPPAGEKQGRAGAQALTLVLTGWVAMNQGLCKMEIIIPYFWLPQGSDAFKYSAWTLPQMSSDDGQRPPTCCVTRDPLGPGIRAQKRVLSEQICAPITPQTSAQPLLAEIYSAACAGSAKPRRWSDQRWRLLFASLRASGGRGLARTRHPAKPATNISPKRRVLCDARLTSERIGARAEQAGAEHRELRAGTGPRPQGPRNSRAEAAGAGLRAAPTPKSGHPAPARSEIPTRSELGSASPCSWKRRNPIDV